MTSIFDFQSAIMEALGFEGRACQSVVIDVQASEMPVVRVTFEPTETELRAIAAAVEKHRAAADIAVATDTRFSFAEPVAATGPLRIPIPPANRPRRDTYRR